ncbi:MAG: peptidylprolyl isomerase [Chloroflexi bacterium]|nr:peptidylprolyl isomerase [Chloroflexota bacterium]
MAKKKMEKPRREMTRRQLSTWEKQKKKQRIILFGGIIIILAAILTVGIGWFQNEYLPLHQTVVRVNNAQFNMDYYIKMLKFYSQGNAENLSPLLDAVAQAIQQNELIKQEAAKLEITVSDEEVDKQLQTLKPPLSKDLRDVIRTQLLRDKLLNDYFLPKVPETAEQRHVLAMFLESEKQANDVRAKLLAGEDFGALAEQVSLDSRSKSGKGDLGWYPKDILAKTRGEKVLEERVFISEVGVVSPPVLDAERGKQMGYWLVKVEDRKTDPQEVLVHGILLGSAEEASSVRARLESGEDFTKLAKELSQDNSSKDNGGILGGVTPGQRKALDSFIFDSSVPIGRLSQPIADQTAPTKGGYWLIKVAGIESDRAINESDRKALASSDFNEWFTALTANPANVGENLLTPEQKAWAFDRAERELAPKGARR